MHGTTMKIANSNITFWN